MPAKWQRETIKVSKKLKPTERIAIATQIIKFIQERTAKGIDKDNKPFPKHKGSKKNPTVKGGKYSKGYAESLDFKNAGKSKSKIDLELTSEMINSIRVLSHRSGEITIGFEKGSDENAKADGNIRGTYGQQRPVQKGRDFLGIHSRDLDRILKKYPTKTLVQIQKAREEALGELKTTFGADLNKLGEKKNPQLTVDISLEDQQIVKSALKDDSNGG